MSGREPISPKQMSPDFLAFLNDRYELGEPLLSMGKRVPDPLAHIAWMVETWRLPWNLDRPLGSSEVQNGNGTAMEPLLTISQVAERLSVSEKTVRRRIAEGDLPVIRLGGPKSAIRVDPLELNAWLRRSVDVC